MKPHPKKWDGEHDSVACVECGKDFKEGDVVYVHIALTVHQTCWQKYLETLERLGLNK